MARTDETPRLNAGSNGDGDIDLIRAAPVLARLAFAAWLRTTGWTLETSIAASTRVLRGAAKGESPTEILSDVGDELRDYVRRVLGVESGANGDGSSGYDDVEPVDAEVVEDDRPTVDRLQEQARDLLRRSADVYDDDEAHPAYARILHDLAPDEARILRFMCREGPQAAVDVRTAGPLALARSDLIAPGLNMIGPGAGVKHPERIKSYLDNLYRLGLIWFSREPLEDPLDYQVLEAQPDVAEAMEQAGRGKTVRRSIHLTDFGDDFCSTVLPDDTDELRAIQAERPSDRKKRKD
jgi:hypothetical protein